MIETLNNLRHLIYEGNKQRGFWENGVNENKGQLVMLIVTELAEAVEAHRKNKRYDKEYNIVSHNTEDISVFKSVFEQHCKNVLEDEIADTVIRILDYTYGFDIPIIKRDYRKESTGNFAHDILRINHYCIEAFHGDIEPPYHPANKSIKDWGYVLASIIKLCEWYNIDLLQHVNWKIQYNSTRPFKHGKKY